MVRIVAFDVMDTLVVDPFREALEAATGRPLAELFARRDAAAYPAFERGELDEPGYWAAFTRAGIDVDPEVFHRVRRAGIALLPGMGALLDDLAGVVVRATASNYPVWIGELARDHLEGRIDRLLASCHLGVRKPEPGFYTALLAALEADAHEVCFVDDRADNVEVARELGLRAHRFVDAVTTRTWLRSEGLAV